MMTDTQMGDFRSRMERILSGKVKPSRVLQRDIYGMIITPRKRKNNLKLVSILRSLVTLFIAFTIFKAVLIQNSDRSDYDQMIANLMAGDSKSQIIAKVLRPDYFTKPVGTFIAGIAGQVESLVKK